MHVASTTPELIISAFVAAIFLMAPLWVSVALSVYERAIAQARCTEQRNQLLAMKNDRLDRMAAMDNLMSSLSAPAYDLVAASYGKVDKLLRRAFCHRQSAPGLPRGAAEFDSAGAADSLSGATITSADDIDRAWAAAIRIPVVEHHLRLVLGMDDDNAEDRLEAVERLKSDMAAARFDRDELSEPLGKLMARCDELTLDPHRTSFIADYRAIIIDYVTAMGDATARRLDTTIASRAWLPGCGLNGMRPWIGSGGGGLAAVGRRRKSRITWFVLALVWSVIMVGGQITAAILFPSWGVVGLTAFLITTVIVVAFAAAKAHHRGVTAAKRQPKLGRVAWELAARRRDVVTAEVNRITLVLNDMDLLARSLTDAPYFETFVAQWNRLRARYDRDTAGFVELVDRGGAWQYAVDNAYDAITDMATAEANLSELFGLQRTDIAVRRRHLQGLMARMEDIADAVDPDRDRGEASYVVTAAQHTDAATRLGDGEADHESGTDALPAHNRDGDVIASVSRQLSTLSAHLDAHDFVDSYTRAILDVEGLAPKNPSALHTAITDPLFSAEDLIIDTHRTRG